MEYGWLKNNFNNITAEEQRKIVQLGIKSWLYSPNVEIKINAHNFVKAMRYLDKLYKKYDKQYSFKGKSK